MPDARTATTDAHTKPLGNSCVGVGPGWSREEDRAFVLDLTNTDRIRGGDDD